jgi:hypothetical protein
VRRASICLRCGWEGSTSSAACPSCGVALFRPQTRDHDRPKPGEGTPETAIPREPAPRRNQTEPTPPRTWKPARVLAAAAVVVLGVAAVAVQVASSRRPSSGPAPPHLSGRLLYTGSGFGQTERILSWDLSSDSVVDGPRLDGAVDMVDSSSVLPGWLGVTVRLPDGLFRAELFRSLQPSADPVALATASITEWTTDGSSVLSVRRTRSSLPEHLSVAITRTEVRTRSATTLFSDRTLNGDVLSVAGGGHPPVCYFSLLDNGSVSVLRSVPDGGSRTVLRGFALLDVSPAGDRLVVPRSDLSLGNDLPGARPPNLLPSPRLVAGRTFYVPAGRFIVPTPYGSSAGDLSVLRVLAWAPDAAYALVIGSLAGRLGIWELRTTPTGRSAPPVFVSPEMGSTTWGTFASGDIPVIESGGLTWVFSSGSLNPLGVPPGTPTPDGPILWIG